MCQKPGQNHFSIVAKLSLLLCTTSFAAVFVLTCTSPTLSLAEQVLSVAGTGSDTSPGQETTYRLELLNHTDQILYDGVLTATLPPGFTYVPDSTVLMGEGWPMESREPVIDGQTLTWGPYHLPAAGIQVHNPFGIHTLMDSCDGIPALHLEGAKNLVGNGGYVTQLFYPIDASTTDPSQCAINFVNEAYARNLIPIIRLQGHRVNGIWQAPNPGINGNYTEIAQAYANYVAGLPRRDTNPLYITVWNEPDLWIEWSNRPNPTQYARFFVAVSNAIRQLGDARIRVVNGALTPGNAAFLNQMLKVPGFRDAFDVWASHCYPYNHPASYNIHSGTAKYGTYTIDCYLEETAIIKAHGRSIVKVLLTETGYALGNNTFGFEGFPAINETNRASYIAAAFKNYWQSWPEIVAVTPFELTDPSGHWSTFDWIYPAWPYPPHPQYEAVAALPKPQGQLQPYGYQVIFKAAVSTNTITGTYTLQLSGSDRDGHTTFETDVAPITVRAPAALESLYLPIILKSPGTQGPWYLSSAATQNLQDNGAIVPNQFFKSASKTLTALNNTNSAALPLSGQPLTLALDETGELGAITLTNGHLEIFNPNTHQLLGTVFAGDNPQEIITVPSSEQAYISLADGLVRINLRTRQIINRRLELGHLRSLAWDSSTTRLFVADAEHNKLLIFNADLSQQLAVYPLEHQPDQLILDSATRQLYVSFPAVPRIIAINVDSLSITAQASLIGGPILDMAFDTNHNRLYALTALAPHHHGITVLDGLILTSTALAAGSQEFPLQLAMALALTPAGELLISEANGVWQVAPDTFTLIRHYPANTVAPPRGLKAHQSDIYMLDTHSTLLRIYQ